MELVFPPRRTKQGQQEWTKGRRIPLKGPSQALLKRNRRVMKAMGGGTRVVGERTRCVAFPLYDRVMLTRVGFVGIADSSPPCSFIIEPNHDMC